MKVIRILKIFFLLILLGACASIRRTSAIKDEKTKSLLETQYLKMFTDATKDVLLYDYYKGAIPLYNACINQFPERAAPYFQLSSVYLKMKNIDLATKYAEKAVSLDSTNIWYMFNLARIYQFNKKYDEAIKVYEKILSIKSDDEILYNLAMLYNMAGRNDEALKILGKMEDENQESREVIIMRHNIYNQMRKYDSAVYELEKIPKNFPEDITGYGMLAEYLTEIGRRNYAKNVYKKMLDIDSTNGMAILSFGEYYLKDNSIDSAFYYFKKAFCCSDLSTDDKINIVLGYVNNDEFIKMNYENVNKLLDQINTKDRKFPFYAAEADLYINIEKYENAKPYLDSALLYEKKNYMLWEQTILINSYLNRDTDVVRIATECLNYFRDKPTVYYFRANAYYDMNQDNLAMIDIDSILQKMPEEKLKVQTLLLGAEIQQKQKNYHKADSTFEEILKIEPENLLVRNNYAYYLSLRSHNLKRAEELSKFTIVKEPYNATYLDTYGWILYKNGEYKEAKSYIESAIRYGAYNNAEVLEHYGDIMIKLNSCSEALEAYEKAIELQSSEDLEDKVEKTKNICK